MAQVIWEVFDNVAATSQVHYANRRDALNAALGSQLSVFTANPGSYWRIESWASEGDIRTTVRAGPGANSTILADHAVYQRSLI